MANNREISQFAGLVTVNDTNNNVSLGSTVLLNGASGVGFNTSSLPPESKVHIVDTAPMMTVDATNGQSGFRLNVRGQSGSGNLFRVQDDGASKVIVTGIGSVGIGSDNPDTIFNVQDGSGDSITKAKIGISGSFVVERNHARFPKISYNMNSGYPRIILENRAGDISRIAAGQDSYIGVGGNRLGIGNSAPVYTLDVSGNVRATSTLTAASIHSGVQNFNTASTSPVTLSYTVPTYSTVMIYIGTASSPSVTYTPGIYMVFRADAGRTVTTISAASNVSSITCSSSGVLTLTPSTSSFRSFFISYIRPY